MKPGDNCDYFHVIRSTIKVKIRVLIDKGIYEVQM